ncbi:MAG: DUF202 domain-containing protein [Nitriliruptorales bacterium]|nr:DUF202 domain-containing protein [Nitriliruptorales bacterium]
MSERLWDPGLQPERTSLAWRRTSLAQVVAGFAVLRFALARGSVVAVAAAAVAVVAGGLTMLLAHKTYLASTIRLRERAPVRSGALPFIASACTALLGVAGLLVHLT